MNQNTEQARPTDICLTVGLADSRGEAILDIWTKKRATRKGVSIWLSCWGGAILTIAIPIVHFLTVPLLLLIGPFAGYLVYKLFNGSVDVLSGSGLCPACKASVVLQPTSANWPLTVTCQSCQAAITVTRDKTKDR